MIEDLETFQRVQGIARKTIDFVVSFMESQRRVTELDLSAAAHAYMREQGIEKYWYYNALPMVLVGEKRTATPISGRDYKPIRRRVKQYDLVVIDVHPEQDGCWGDCTRAMVVENGKVVKEQKKARSPLGKELWEGIADTRGLHEYLREIAIPGMTFEELYHKMETRIGELHYLNIDNRGNFGHNLPGSLPERLFIEAGCKRRLEEGPFTFEPHLKKEGLNYGFWHENIYYFEGKELRML